MVERVRLACGKIIQVSPDPRARRRLVENEADAKDARFWIGKIKSADRMLYDRPADRNAFEELHPKQDSLL